MRRACRTAESRGPIGAATIAGAAAFLAASWTLCDAAPPAAETAVEKASGQSPPVKEGDFINAQIRQAWADNEVSPSGAADDSEWIRRAYLDIVGHIPPAYEVEPFLRDRNRAKRAELIDRLLENPDYARHWTTVWTNLTVGRQMQQGINRKALEKFFREAFGRNRPWNEVVFDLVSAEGHNEKNGAVNYLLAQMANPDEGVQATAKTTRLFLGIQVQCTQCHNHPKNQWKQEQFWQFNSFFRQARRVDHRKYDPSNGMMVSDFTELVLDNFSGPVFFEKRSGLMEVAYPTYFETRVSPEQGTDRRTELARLMTEGEKPLIAAALVNRMWGHFFGFGFTQPLDDMGPHNPPSHPELLDRLSADFVAGGYDLKQLVRRICNSEAYQLTSAMGKGNASDNPAAGELPLFSRVYVKTMEAEQLFDSLLVATDAHRTGRTSWEDSELQRDAWLSQFVIAFGNDEKEETTTFNGTIPQALAMMNGELVQRAISTDAGGFLNRVLTSKDSESEKIRKLYIAALCREPSRREAAAARQLLQENPDPAAGYQDLFWALLNSNEFILNH